MQSNWFALVLGSLATYRLALMISKEEGPFWIFRKLRRLPPPKSNARQGLSCEWCVSVWVSSLTTTFLWRLGAFSGVEWPLWWLAISAGAIIANQQWSKGD